MRRANFGAASRVLSLASVLTLLAVPSGAQIVERSQTWDSLIQSHPCNAGMNGRHTILTDAQSSSSIGGGGGSVRVFVECDGVDTWSIVSIGGGGGGSGDVVGPASATDNAIARFDGTTGKLLQNTASAVIADNGGIYVPEWYGGGTTAATAEIVGDASFVYLGSGVGLGWSSAATPDGSSYVLDTKFVRAAAGIAKLTSALHLDPLASPPRTCDATAEGDIYSDTSHALCWCDGTTWQKLSGAGTCA